MPDSAWAVLNGLSCRDVQALAEQCGDITCRREGTASVWTLPALPGTPPSLEGTENAIQKLADFLWRHHLATGAAERAVKFLSEAFSDAYGKGLNIDFSDDISGKTTHVGGMVRLEKGRLVQNINVRYAIQADVKKLQAQLQECCAAAGFAVKHLHNSPPCYTPPTHPAIPCLLRAYQDVYGAPAKP